jgi:hypothetical protein
MSRGEPTGGVQRFGLQLLPFIPPRYNRRHVQTQIFQFQLRSRRQPEA